MSTKWYLACVTCGDVDDRASNMGITDAWRMVDLAQSFAEVYSLLQRECEVRYDWRTPVSLTWFSRHDGHAIVPMSEYGDRADRCAGIVAGRFRCAGPRNHKEACSIACTGRVTMGIQRRTGYDHHPDSSVSSLANCDGADGHSGDCFLHPMLLVERGKLPIGPSLVERIARYVAGDAADTSKPVKQVGGLAEALRRQDLHKQDAETRAMRLALADGVRERFGKR